MHPWCNSPDKLDRVLALHRRGIDLVVLLDSVEQATGVAEASTAADIRIPALLEVDCDGHRGGVLPEDPAALAIAATRTTEEPNCGVSLSTPENPTSATPPKSSPKRRTNAGSLSAWPRRCALPVTPLPLSASAPHPPPTQSRTSPASPKSGLATTSSATWSWPGSASAAPLTTLRRPPSPRSSDTDQRRDGSLPTGAGRQPPATGARPPRQ
jgi:hypothetical protein